MQKGPSFSVAVRWVAFGGFFFGRKMFSLPLKNTPPEPKKNFSGSAAQQRCTSHNHSLDSCSILTPRTWVEDSRRASLLAEVAVVVVVVAAASPVGAEASSSNSAAAGPSSLPPREARRGCRGSGQGRRHPCPRLSPRCPASSRRAASAGPRRATCFPEARLVLGTMWTACRSVPCRTSLRLG